MLRSVLSFAQGCFSRESSNGTVQKVAASRFGIIPLFDLFPFKAKLSLFSVGFLEFTGPITWPFFLVHVPDSFGYPIVAFDNPRDFPLPPP